jgi:predicted kinase
MSEQVPRPQEIVILVGLQASGKSSFYRQRFAQTHALVSKDAFPSARNKARRQIREIASALVDGRSVVVDNTNVTVDDRAEIVSQARSAGARVVCFYFESKLADCLVRNVARSGAARVPDVALRSMVSRLVVPSRTEGFDELWYVRTRVEGGFDVLAWEEP